MILFEFSINRYQQNEFLQDFYSNNMQ